MSTSLKIQHGDLALNGNSYASISGGDKLLQDLRCALLTPLGFFDEYPTYGSVLDSTIDSDIIGQINWQLAATKVQAEINRVCSDYQKTQISRNQEDAQRFGKLTISADEMLLSVEDMRFIQVEDKLLVSVVLKVGQASLELTIPVAQ